MQLCKNQELCTAKLRQSYQLLTGCRNQGQISTLRPQRNLQTDTVPDRHLFCSGRTGVLGQPDLQSTERIS